MRLGQEHERADQGRDHRNPVAEGRSLRTMNPDSTRPDPGDDATAARAHSDLMDTIALEAVTAVATPRPEVPWPSQRIENGDTAGDPVPAVGEDDPIVGCRLGAY